MSIQLENGKIRLEWDENGVLTELTNIETQNNIINSCQPCRIILGHDKFLEFEAFPTGVCRAESADGFAAFHYDKVTAETGDVYDISLDLKTILDGNDIRWSVSVVNNTCDVTVREVHYPVISIRNPAPPLRVHNSDFVSTTYPDLPAMLNANFTKYMAPDHKYIRHTKLYPGQHCSLNFFILDYGKEILYYGCHDPEFLFTGHGFEMDKDKRINCFMARMPFVAPHGSMSESVVVTSLISDSWQAGVQKYRKWADSWFVAPTVPEHIRNSFGWQRCIMHHQYGEYFFRYSDLPEILSAGLPSGVDTIFLFGWTKEGMDAGYPAYTPDPDCGGFDELRKNILKVREMGGHVIIYFNGQLIDTASDFYRCGNGQAVSIKRADGTEHREFYNFSNTGVFTRIFGNKTFTVACPACREWIDILKEHIDKAYALGADGVFFDQLGYGSYPCCDPTHGHAVPFTGLMQSKRELCRELYEYAKSKSPDFAIGIECPTDQTAQYADFVHVFGNPAQVWNPDFRKNGTRPRLKCEAPLFSAAFPEVYLTDREIRDDSDVEFPVNQLLIQQRRSDVEIYRCRANITATPHYKEYLKLVNDLRSRYKDILLNGQMTGAREVVCSDPVVICNAFRKDGQLAVVMTQSSKDSVTAEFVIRGYEVIEYASARNDVSLTGNTITLPCDSVAVILCRKL